MSKASVPIERLMAWKSATLTSAASATPPTSPFAAKSAHSSTIMRRKLLLPMPALCSTANSRVRSMSAEAMVLKTFATAMAIVMAVKQ